MEENSKYVLISQTSINIGFHFRVMKSSCYSPLLSQESSLNMKDPFLRKMNARTIVYNLGKCVGSLKLISVTWDKSKKRKT